MVAFWHAADSSYRLDIKAFRSPFTEFNKYLSSRTIPSRRNSLFELEESVVTIKPTYLFGIIWMVSTKP